MTKLILDPLGNSPVTITEADLIDYQISKVHTGVGSLEATVAGRFDEIQPFVQRKARFDFEINGNVEFNGFVIQASEDKATGEVRLRGAGIANRLEETRPDYSSLGGSLTFSNISVADALRDYWKRTPFDGYNVFDENTEVVASDEQIQAADTNTEFTNLTSLKDTDPFVIQNGRLELAQVGFFREAETQERNNVGTTFGTIVSNADENESFSNAEALELDGNGQSVEIEFNLDHRIPAEEANIRALRKLDNLDADVVLKLDNDELRRISRFDTSSTLDWAYGFGSLAPTLFPGTHSMEIQLDNYSNGRLIIDCVHAQDDRFSYVEDTSVDSNDALSGPEEFPQGERVNFSEGQVSFNVTDATVEVTEQDNETINEVAISADGGSTFKTAAGNTNTFNISEQTRSVEARIELGRYAEDSTTSPTNGDAGHAVELYTFSVSGNDLTVIDELELSRNHFENLKTLHEFGDFNFVISHSAGTIAEQEVNSFTAGSQSKPKIDGFDDPQNQSAEVAAQRYYNSILLQGAKDSSGNRPTAEKTDSQAVSDDGRKISPGILRDQKITTQAGAEFRAQSLLDAAKDNNILVGSVTVPPVSTDPGFARSIDFGNGEQEKTVERVILTESVGTAQAEFEFGTVEDIAQQISELRSNARDIGDQV